MVDSEENSPRQVLAGRYELGARVGTPGRLSAVFEAIDLRLERAVAVKMLDPHAVATPELLNRFRTVAQELIAVSHPNIAAVYDFGEEDIDGVLTPYLVMELLSGGSLRAILDRGRTLSPSQALLVGLDICRGLDHAHRKGIIHGDVKPSNMLFGADRRLRIADFGVTRLVGQALGAEASAIDITSARYASPEQAQAKRIDGRSDVYSLALVLVECVTGQVPFAADTTVATLAARIDRLLPVSADLGALAAVLERAGRPNPTERSNASEFGRALVQAAGQMPRPKPLPLASEGASLFDAPAGQETTTELTRFADPTGQLRRDSTGAIERDPSGTIRRDPTGPITRDPSGAIARDPSGVIVRDPSTAIPRDLTGGSPRDPSGAIPRPRLTDPTGSTPRPRVVGVDEQGRAKELAPSVRRRPVITYLLLVLGLLVAGTLGLVAYRKLTVPSFEVPPLIGVDVGVADNQIASNEWVVDVQHERSETQAQGKIVRTDPIAGVKIKRGGPFTIVVSDGPPPSPLPELVDKPIDEALAALTAVGLVGQQAEAVYSETVLPGIVLSWQVTTSPGLKAGAAVVRGTLVDIVVSNGPAPREVKDLIGANFDGAVQILAAQGLTLTKTGEDFSDDVPVGAIMAQSVAKNTKVERGATVEVTVSKGPDVVPVPPIGGATFDAAKAALEAVGFTIGSYTGNYFTGTVSGVSLHGQQVVGLQPVKRGSSLDLTFSS